MGDESVERAETMESSSDDGGECGEELWVLPECMEASSSVSMCSAKTSDVIRTSCCGPGGTMGSVPAGLP